MKGEFEQRLRSVIDEVQSSPTPIILFIDEAHTLIGAGGAAGTGDAANLLKPALARGTLAHDRRHHLVRVPAIYREGPGADAGASSRSISASPTSRPRRVMLRGLVAPMEKHHKVRVSDEAIVAAVNFSHRYIPARQLARQGGQPARHRLRARRDQPERQAGGDRGRGSRRSRRSKPRRRRSRGSAISARPMRSASPRSTSRSRPSARSSPRSRRTGRRSARWSRKSWRCATDLASKTEAAEPAAPAGNLAAARQCRKRARRGARCVARQGRRARRRSTRKSG